MAARWLARRRWGRRLLWAFTLRTVRARLRRLLHELAELYPVLAPLAAWV